MIRLGLLPGSRPSRAISDEQGSGPFSWDRRSWGWSL